MTKMTKDQVIDYFVENHLQGVMETYEQDGIVDVPARREEFNNMTDYLCQDGQITEELYNEISLPDYLEFRVSQMDYRYYTNERFYS